MNSQFKLKLIQTLNKKNGNKGFTLIELLVVVIIIGVLAAIALPNLLGQVAKGRQAEARNNLGAINRAQQAYRLETATFGPIASLPLQIPTTQYYTIGDAGTANATNAGTIANARTEYQNDIRDYVAGVAQNSTGSFSAVLCEQTTDLNANLAASDLVQSTAGAVSCGTNANRQVK